VDFQYSSEHVELRQAVRRLLENHAPEAAVRAVMDSELGWDRALYTRLAGELGVVGMAVPEEFGGVGYGLLEAGLVLQEAGRAVLPGPLLSVTLGAQALVLSGDSGACAEVLPDVVAGEVLVTVALREAAGWAAPLATTAEPGPDGGWQVTGAQEWVLDAVGTDLLVVPARTSAGVSLFLVDVRTADGVQTTPIGGVDPTRRQGRVVLTAAPARLLGTDGGSEAALGQLRAQAVVLLAAEQLGVAQRCLQMATDYAKIREQFGRKIGSFQAIKHKLADVLLEVEAAESAVMFGLFSSDGADDLAVVAAIVGSTCAEAALLAAGENIQVHGGIGATWEHPAHLYLKRATTSRFLFGDPQQHLEALAVHLDLGAPTGAPPGAA
jgi:alkylation response protein AidB-like acyl-CoA dehydrogenase